MINTGQIAALLEPGLNAVFGDYATYPEQWKDIYKTYTSDKNQETDVEMRYLGAAAIKNEGQPIVADNGMGQRITTNYIHKTVGLSFSITKEALEDDQYKNDFPKKAVSLKNSLSTTKNILAANILNNAFNVNHPIGDGQALCSTTHPIDGGTYANKTEAFVDLSEAGIEDALVAIQKFKSQSGILAQTKGKCIIIPAALQFVANRLLNSQYRASTADNDINALYGNAYLPGGYKVNQYLTSPTNWFILTDAPDGMKHFQRTGVKTDTYVEFQTDNIICKATERYSFGVSNPRAIYGSGQ